jgi:SAM-dependent methyltransferase
MTLNRAIEELDRFSLTLDSDCQEYWRFHRNRYFWTGNLLNELIEQLRSKRGNKITLLDIGLCYQTLLFLKLFPDISIHTLGYRDGRYIPDGKIKHIDFDLNDTYYPEKCSPEDFSNYDVITMLEVIEHLYTSPLQVFMYLNQLLRPGGLLVVQTPNAVSLSKRIAMLKGYNPFERIRENMRENPGHFRESTRHELCHMATLRGFTIKEEHMMSYFCPVPGLQGKLISKLSEMLPGDFREGMTLVLTKAER